MPPPAFASAAPLRPRIVEGERVLLLADEPERVAASGVLYSDVVAGPFRVFAYTLADAGPMRLRILATADRPTTVRLERAGAGGPGAGFFQVGRAALEGWLHGRAPRQALTAGPRPADLLPALSAAAAARGQAVNGVLDATADGPVRVTVRAEVGGAARDAVVPPGPRPAGVPMRGTFACADVSLAAEDCVPGTALRLAHIPSYLTGHSAVDERAVVNYGNYGVGYRITLRAPQGGAQSSVVFVPLGGGFCGSMRLQDRAVALAAPGGRQLDAYQGLHLGALSPAAPWTIEWMPPAASYLSVALMFV